MCACNGIGGHLILICREKNLEVAKKEAKAKEKKNEEKQAASKDDIELDQEERMQEVWSLLWI